MSDEPTPTPATADDVKNAHFWYMIVQSIIFAALLAAQSVLSGVVAPEPAPPAPVPTPIPIPPEPLPVTDFGRRVLSAFQADGGTKSQAVDRGALYIGMARAIEKGAAATGAEVGEANQRAYIYSDVPRAGPQLKSVMVEVLNRDLGGGALDEAKRATAQRIYREAGEALLNWGQQ